MIERGHISDYRLVDVLGRGGMGVVYQAIHDPSGQPAAVKTVRVATESTLESIRREIHTLRELRHPGVIAIRDHGVVDGMPWYAMELLRGRTLRDDFRAWFPDPAPAEAMTRDLLRPGKLREPLDPDVAPVRTPGPAYSLAHVIELFHKLCEPLAYVHGQGVIHRDLSPANVFVKGTNDPVLFDFGLAAQFRIDSAREVLEVGGLTRGTPHYMAPEQARGEVVDARADVYAVGCLLYEALTGRPPFLGDSTLAVMMQHIDDVPRRPASLVPEIPPALDDLVMRMLAKAPRDRIGYIEDVAAALERMGATAPRVAEGRPRAYTYRPGLAGRTELIDQIDQLLIALAAGTGGSAYLIGESGVGKTRLAGEIATRARDHDIRVITGECEPHGGPLHPLRPLFHAVAARCREGGRLEAQRLLGHNGAVLAAFEPSLAAFAPAADPHETSTFHGPEPLTGSAARFRVLGVLRELLAELTVGEPLLLVLDDLQWADELTLALLGALGHELAGNGLFVLATMRAEEVTPELESVLAATGATRFDVRRLDRAAVGAMVRDMLALDEAAPTLTEFVASQSEGNPLFAAEYVRSAVDEGVLQRDSDGRWRLSPRDDDSYESLPTPGSVQSLMRRRLRTLSAPAREVSLAMAVLGRSCEEAVLAATVQLTADRAAEAITELIQRHVIEDHGDGQLRFVHDKLREQTYAELTVEQQRALHHRAAQAIEARYRDDADRQLHQGQLAYHWEAAGELARATDCLERAAEHALTAAAFGEAQAMLRHLLALPIAAASTRRARWERRLGETCYALGDVAGLGTHTERALDELDRPLTGSRLRIAARIAGGIGQQLAARVLPRRRREGAERTREPAVVEAALASAQMTHYYFFNDDSLGLVGAALAAANLAERAGDDLPIAEIYAQLGYASGLARLGGVARSYFAKARATAKATRDPSGLVKVQLTEAAFGIGTGAWRAASVAAGEALAGARALRNPHTAEDALTILGHVEFATGRYAASRDRSIELRDSARARTNAQHEAWGIYTEARAALYLGQLAEAIALFDRALEMLESQSDRASLILCGGMRACALARAGDLERAREAADATTARIGSRTPAVFTIAAGLVGVADAYLELWRRTGDPALDPPTRAAVDNLGRLARLFPSAAPAAYAALGTYQLRRGAPRRAAQALDRALADAIRLEMPYDRAIAHHGLAELGGARAIDHTDAARRLFRELGCTWHSEL